MRSVDKPAHSATHATSLDALDHGILESVTRHPDAPLAQWAAENEVNARTVARRFEALRRRGVIRVIGRTLPGFGGRLAWLMRISASPAQLSRIATDLAALPSTRWVRHSMDRGELICGIAAAPSDYTDLLARLYSYVPARDVRSYQLVRVWGHSDAAVTGAELIDDLDRQMLEHYAVDGRLSAARLAERLGVDPATVSRHRRRLVDAGILYFEADIDPDVLSNFGDFNLWLQVRPGAVAEVGKRLRTQPETRFVAATSGSHQIYANVVMPDAAALVPFLDGLEDLGITAVETVPMGIAVKRAVA